MQNDDDIAAGLNRFWNTFGVNNTDAKINELEAKLLRGRVWQEKGETSAKKRQKDALLDAELEFETGLEKELFVSEKINLKYEDIVKQRVKDEMFDDRTFEAFYLNKLAREQQQFSLKNAGCLSSPGDICLMFVHMILYRQLLCYPLSIFKFESI